MKKNYLKRKRDQIFKEGRMKNNNDINIGKLLGESIVDVVKHRIKQENLTETVREKLDSAIKNREDIIKETTEKFSETFKKLSKDEEVNHPPHYGGDTTYEVIKVLEAWELGFHLGNVIKYVVRANKKDPKKELQDLRKAQWYLERYIESKSKVVK
jgi:hypothetical protein